MTSFTIDKMFEIYTFFDNRTEICFLFENRFEIYSYMLFENRTATADEVTIIPITIQGGFEDNDHTTLKPTKSRNLMRIEKANTFLLSTQYRLELEGKLFRKCF